MQSLVVDANFLMSAYKFKVDAMSALRELVGKYELVTCSSVIIELQGLSKSRGPAGPQARQALLSLAREGARVVRTIEPADDWIVNYCAQHGAIACTNDAALRKRLRENGVRSIVLKGRSRIDFG